MYDSVPRGREGEPIEQIVPEAIRATASRNDDQRRTAHTRGRAGSRADAQRNPNRVFICVAALAAVEAVALLLYAFNGGGIC